MTVENEEAVRAAYAAFRKKNIPGVMETIADDFRMVVPGKSIQSGTFDGKDGLRRTSR